MRDRDVELRLDRWIGRPRAGAKGLEPMTDALAPHADFIWQCFAQKENER